MREQFEALAHDIEGSLRGEERFTSTWHAEETDFVRLNRSAVRQAGHVSQKRVSIELIRGRRHSSGSMSVTPRASATSPASSHRFARHRSWIALWMEASSPSSAGRAS